MKTNGSDSGGGSLDPAWAQAYANYLVEYLRLYARSGIPISLVGFVNEPDISTSYASMVESPAQAADFVKVLGPTLARSGLRTRIACCDATGWDVGRPYIDAILSDPAAARWLAVATAHGYSSPPAYPLTDRRPVWETEWAHLGTPWDPAWDDGTPGAGIAWAQNVMQSFTAGDVNAFFYRWGAHGSNSNSGLIRMVGDSYEVSKRFWAIAAFSRFVQPGAVRVEASSTLPVSAFHNPDGSVVVQVLNTGRAPVDVALPASRAYLVDATHDLARVAVHRNHAVVPARALETFVMR
jgi:glucosylceramidase